MKSKNSILTLNWLKLWNILKSKILHRTSEFNEQMNHGVKKLTNLKFKFQHGYQPRTFPFFFQKLLTKFSCKCHVRYYVKA